MADITGLTPALKLPDDLLEQLHTAVTESNAIYSGRGSSHSVTQTVLTKFDKYGSSAVQLNADHVGMTFFTRPRLNLTTSSLRQDRVLAMLDTLDPLSWMFSVRCNLDTEFSKSNVARDLAELCPWFNNTSAFNVPLTNMMIGISGWPDFSVEYESTESGYFSESQTTVRGSDRGRRNYDLSCTFREIQGGYIMAYFYYWLYAMALQMEGSIVPYPDDRAANRLNYTCSIYRFVLDPSLRTITKWAKATGCYPVSVPIGDVFNYGPGDSFSHTSQQFTVPFKANNIQYNDPIHLQAFNTLVNRYADEPDSDIFNSPNRVKAVVSAETNFTGLPFVDLYSGTNELLWLARKEELVDPTEAVFAKIKAQMESQIASYKASDTTKKA